MSLGQPLNELPIAGREQLLLVGRAQRQFDDLAQLPDLLARARAQQVQLNRQAVPSRLFLVGLRSADRAQEGPWGIKVRRLGREEPRFQLPHKLLFLRRLLHLGEPVEVRVNAQLSRQRAPGAQKHKSQFLQSRARLRRQQPRPPIRARKILARERELLEVVLQQQRSEEHTSELQSLS